jgi:Ca2+-binding RTX toxin-like protein
MRATILILSLLCAVSASAADNDANTAEATSATAAQAPGRAPQQPPTTTAPAQRPATPAPEPAERKRRGSMVGYISDATVDSQVRVRFDAGFHNNVPDRAEFFYPQCGCNSPSAPGPGKVGAGDLVTDLKFQTVSVEGQYSIKGRAAVFVAVPLRFVQPQSFLGEELTPSQPSSFTSQGGLSDIRAGVKAAIVSDDQLVLTAQVQGYFQSGDAKEGLGTGHASVEPALLLYSRLADRVAIESQVGDWHPINGSSVATASGTASYAGDVLFYGVGPSFEVVRTPTLTFAPVVELVGWRVLGGQQQIRGQLSAAAGTNIVNLKVGARTIVNNRSSFYLGYGRALTDAVWYTDIVRFEYRYSF